jgi:hypothetical protein
MLRQVVHIVPTGLEKAIIGIFSVVRRQAGWCSSVHGQVAFLSLRHAPPLRVTFERCILGKLWPKHQPLIFAPVGTAQDIGARQGKRHPHQTPAGTQN